MSKAEKINPSRFIEIYLEFIVNELGEEKNITMFITTHLSIVLNLIDPEEIWICKPTNEEIKIKMPHNRKVSLVLYSE